MTDAVKMEMEAGTGTRELVVLEGRNRDGFYRRLRQRVVDWAETKTGRESKWLKYVLVAPDLFHLLCRLSVAREVSFKMKTRLALVIIYFTSPIDVMPEVVFGPAGYLDDVALTAYFLNQLVNVGGAAVVVRYWAGDGDVLQLIKKIAAKADEMIGSGLWDKVRKVLSD